MTNGFLVEVDALKNNINGVQSSLFDILLITII